MPETSQNSTNLNSTTSYYWNGVEMELRGNLSIPTKMTNWLQKNILYWKNQVGLKIIKQNMFTTADYSLLLLFPTAYSVMTRDISWFISTNILMYKWIKNNR